MEKQNIFAFKLNNTPQVGSILLAEPMLPDPNFVRAVILLTQHEKEGTVGFVMNHVAENKIGHFIPELENVETDVYIGGPVQLDTMHTVHSLSYIEDSVEIRDGLFWGGNFEQIMDTVLYKPETHSQIKFLIGYSGWSSGQLDDELKENAWVVSNNYPSEELFTVSPDKLWSESVKHLGGKFPMFVNYPVDPRLN